MEGLVNPSFWKGKKVFLTGHTGFKGNWLTLWLVKMGAQVTGYALPPLGSSLFQCANTSVGMKKHCVSDIGDLSALNEAVAEAVPDIIIHMAAQALVRESYANPVATYQTNVMGTVNLFEAVRKTPSVKVVLNVTSDKSYENKEWPWGYRENEAMGGHDPYSSSKGCSELVSDAYRRSFFEGQGVALATARAGNVIGGGDWAKDRIIPDAIHSFTKGEALEVRYPNAVRPWQHVFEPLRGYLVLCQSLMASPQAYSEAWNFGPREQDAQPVSVLAETLCKYWGNEAHWRSPHQDNLLHEAHYLKLDCSKARSYLKWQPTWALDEALARTVAWYKAWHQGDSMRAFSEQQLEAYIDDCERAYG